MQYLAEVALNHPNSAYSTAGLSGAIGYKDRTCKTPYVMKPLKDIRMPHLTWSHEYPQFRGEGEKLNCLAVTLNMIENRWMFKNNKIMATWATYMNCNQSGITKGSINIRMNHSYPAYVKQVEDEYHWLQMVLTQVMLVPQIQAADRNREVFEEQLNQGYDTLICITNSVSNQQHAYVFRKDPTDNE